MAKKYWQDRALADEAKAQYIAENELLAQRKLYEKAYKQLENELNALYTQIQEKGIESLTRSELYRLSKYKELKASVVSEMEAIAASQVDGTTKALTKIVTTASNSVDRALKSKLGIAFNTISKAQVKKILSTNWSGTNYSTRIWENTSAIAKRIEKDITDMVMLGKNPMAVKSKLMQDLSVSYNAADRLVRTEASRVYNDSSMSRYKDAGVEKIEVLIGKDDRTCSECSEKAGVYEVGKEPHLPIHPNCRCCYVPVIDLESETAMIEKAKNDRAINRYATGQSYSVNEKLRAGIELTDAEKQYIMRLDKALESMPVYEGTVYRSVSGFGIEDIDAFVASHVPGEIKTFSSYTSTGAKVYDESFPIQYVITSKTGRDIRDYNPKEAEILFERNKKFEVLRVVGRTIYMREV